MDIESYNALYPNKSIGLAYDTAQQCWKFVTSHETSGTEQFYYNILFKAESTVSVSIS